MKWKRQMALVMNVIAWQAKKKISVKTDNCDSNQTEIWAVVSKLFYLFKNGVILWNNVVQYKVFDVESPLFIYF